MKYVPGITAPVDEWMQRHMRHAYYAAVSWVDAQIGRVLDVLDALGVAGYTVVVFHGDHGWQLGAHNSWHKQTNFELGTRVPLIIRAPFKARSAGRHTATLAELVDIYPTLAELTGSPPPRDAIDGVSLAPLFDDPAQATIPDAKHTLNKTVAYQQFPHKTDHGCTFVRNGTCVNNTATGGSLRGGGGMMGFCVRDARWRYCVWLPYAKKPLYVVPDWSKVEGAKLEELYDHADDPAGHQYDLSDVANVAYDKRRTRR